MKNWNAEANQLVSILLRRDRESLLCIPALKGPINTAQGKALGFGVADNVLRPERAGTSFVAPFEGEKHILLGFPRASPWAMLTRPFRAKDSTDPAQQNHHASEEETGSILAVFSSAQGWGMATERANDLRAFRQFIDEQFSNGGSSLTLEEALA